ncbi:MAG: pyridoxal phosphate-dependent aminotransferase [Fimbriimonadaceae bacterium]
MKTLALSTRAGLLRPSPTLSITARANAMRGEGIDVISFAAGEPDFRTPEPVCEEAIQALHEGFTRYTPSAGILPLREAIAEKLQLENGLTVSPNDVVVSCGAKHSVYNALQVLVEAGDEVILLAPYWMTYADQVRLAGASPVVVRSDAATNFTPDIAAIQAAVTPRTRAIIVNSPSNPTGAMYDRDLLAQIVELAERNELWIISDEIYDRLTYGSAHYSTASLGDHAQERTVTIGGCSKSYAMTGWRIGFAAAPSPVAKAMSNFQDQVTSNPTSFAQRGATVAFGLPANVVAAMRDEFHARRDLIVRLLNAIPGLSIKPPSGAFYAFVDASSYMGGDDAKLAEHLLATAGVATIPGSVFEGRGYLRLSYATSRENIQAGIERMAEALDRMR